jgi:AcrR family transcriptional regulator
VSTPPTGLRERKKATTRAALRDAALRLALQKGAQNVRVEEIAEAAGVSLRTYNNYFSSREHAIVAAVTAEREQRIAAAVVALGDLPLSDAVVESVVEQYSTAGDEARDALVLVTTDAALRAAYVQSATTIEGPLAEAIAARSPGMNDLTARVLAATVGAAVKVAVGEWIQSTATSSSGLVVPSGSLAELIRAALWPLRPALDGASSRETDQEARDT